MSECYHRPLYHQGLRTRRKRRSLVQFEGFAFSGPGSTNAINILIASYSVFGVMVRLRSEMTFLAAEAEAAWSLERCTKLCQATANSLWSTSNTTSHCITSKNYRELMISSTVRCFCNANDNKSLDGFIEFEVSWNKFNIDICLSFACN